MMDAARNPSSTKNDGKTTIMVDRKRSKGAKDFVPYQTGSKTLNPQTEENFSVRKQSKLSVDSRNTKLQNSTQKTQTNIQVQMSRNDFYDAIQEESLHNTVDNKEDVPEPGADGKVQPV